MDRLRLLCELAAGVLDGVLRAAGAHQSVGERSHDPGARRCQVTLVEIGAASTRT